MANVRIEQRNAHLATPVKVETVTTRDGDWVGVKAGLKIADRVVTRGAYEVQLASAAKGLPAEGHVH